MPAISFNNLIYPFEETLDIGGKPVVVCTQTGEVWADRPGITDKQTLRIKFLALAIFNIIYFPVQCLSAKIYDLVSGKVVKKGLSLAREEWLNEQKYLDENSEEILASLKRKHVFIQIVKSIIKIVLFPLQMIAIEFGALWGIMFPYDGRKICSNVDDLFSSPIVSKKRVGFFINEYAAPCMQTKQNWNRKNIGRIWYKKDGPRQTTYRLSKKLERLGPFIRHLGHDPEKINDQLKFNYYLWAQEPILSEIKLAAKDPLKAKLPLLNYMNDKKMESNNYLEQRYNLSKFISENRFALSALKYNVSKMLGYIYCPKLEQAVRNAVTNSMSDSDLETLAPYKMNDR